jgi:hypothetical protein
LRSENALNTLHDPSIPLAVFLTRLISARMHHALHSFHARGAKLQVTIARGIIRGSRERRRHRIFIRRDYFPNHYSGTKTESAEMTGGVGWGAIRPMELLRGLAFGHFE